LNMGIAELGFTGLTFATTTTGFVKNQSAPANAMHPATPSAASPFMIISPEYKWFGLTGENHVMLLS
jgi:hypothetical protein